MAQETEKSFPFDAEETETGYDKEYVADDFARYFRAFISSGIFIKDATNLQVIANGDMAVTLKAGKMIIDGYRYENTGDIIITIDPADGVLGRIDRISVTWSKDDRDIHYTLQKGTPSYEPVAPECRRTEEYKDYVVADIYVAAGVIKIQQQNITDQRLNSDVCGLAIPFSELNTDAIFTQYQDAVNEFLKFADTCIDGTVVGQIEEDLENKLDKTGDSGDNVVAFTQTSGRQNIMTGDTHKTIFGKIKKWLADLTATAFAQMITTKEDLLATKVTGYVPDAKAVADGFADVNRKLCQYNSETDCLDIFVDGEVIGSIPCNFQKFKFANTKGSDWICNSNMSVYTDGTNITFKPANLASGGAWNARYTKKITIKNGAQLYYSVGNNALFWSGNLQYSADGTNWTSLKTFATGSGGTGAVALSSGDYYFMFSGWSNNNPTDAVFSILEIR